MDNHNAKIRPREKTGMRDRMCSIPSEHPGKNGDQIQRLFRCPADVFIVQYWREVEDSVYEQMMQFAQLKSYFENRTIWHGVIDGDDSNRLMLAYQSKFPGVVIK